MLNELTKVNTNMNIIIKKGKNVELNTTIVTEILNKQTFHMINEYASVFVVTEIPKEF